MRNPFKKNATPDPSVSKDKLMQEFYNDWFIVKYDSIFKSNYLINLPYVFDDYINNTVIENIQLSVPDKLSDMVALTDLKLEQIVTLEAAFLTLGFKILDEPSRKVEPKFSTFYHDFLPHILDDIKNLDKFGYENDYPTKKIDATVKNIKYMPSNSWSYNDYINRDKINRLDDGFYDNFQEISQRLYDSIFEILNEFHQIDFKSRYDDTINRLHIHTSKYSNDYFTKTTNEFGKMLIYKNETKEPVENPLYIRTVLPVSRLDNNDIYGWVQLYKPEDAQVAPVIRTVFNKDDATIFEDERKTKRYVLPGFGIFNNFERIK